MTSDRSSANNPGGTSGIPISADVIHEFADTTDTSPFDLPILNEIVDPDALNTLFEPTGSPTPALSESESLTAVVALKMGERTATIESNGSIAVQDQSTTLREALGVIDDAVRATTYYNWNSSQSLISTVVSTVATATESDPVTVRNAIREVINQTALNTLFRPRANGVSRGEGGLRVPFQEYDIVILSDGTVSVQPTLTRINQTGGNLLVVGSVPREISETVSRGLLGSAEDRARIFAVRGHDHEFAIDCLTEIGADPSRTLILDHDQDSRSVAAADASPQQLSVRPVVGDLDTLASELVSGITMLAETCDGLSPGQLRVCLDSIGSIQSQYDQDAIRSFLRTVTDQVEQASGIGHYVLLAERTSKHVRVIEDLFDVIVELRVSADGHEQRWHIRENEHSTEWLQINTEENGLRSG